MKKLGFLMVDCNETLHIYNLGQRSVLNRSIQSKNLRHNNYLAVTIIPGNMNSGLEEKRGIFLQLLLLAALGQESRPHHEINPWHFLPPYDLFASSAPDDLPERPWF